MALYAKNITVSFPGVKALEDVDIELQPNRVHALLGANGSGKSTLVKVLTGVYHPDKDCGAQIIVGDNEVADIANPTQAQELGIRVVHQETPLINSFTVAECVGLSKGYMKRGAGPIKWKKIYQYVEELFSFFQLKLDPNTIISDLTASERNMLAMSIAIGKDEEAKQAATLLLDEADASVPQAEAETFLQHVRRIAAMGIPVGIVTHRLQAVRQFCDDVTILNGGKKVYQGIMADTPDEFIIERMSPLFNRETNAIDENEVRHEKSELRKLWGILHKTAPVKNDQPVLEFKDVYAETLKGLDFELYSGEILGFIGVPDSGVTELPLALGCDHSIISGTYKINNQIVKKSAQPRTAYKMGLSLLPSDRPKRGGIGALSLQDNMCLPNEMQFWHKNKLRRKMMDESVQLFDIHPHNNYNMEFGKFSGGNQQKAIMGKWLSTCPSVFVLDDPTYGVDPASRLKLFEAIRAAAEDNVGVIIFSTEPEQLEAICTRILVLSKGRTILELTKAEGNLTREIIARWCYA